MSDVETILRIDISYYIKRLRQNIARQNYCVIWAREQRRGLKNVLNRANVINVRFCSIIGKFNI